jgi:diadenosine tetraphosphate (Ap4A) HIT family hydrolase
VFAIEDNYPVTKGHLLVIARRHTSDFFSMTPAEVEDATRLLRQLRERSLRRDATITGFNIGMNCGILSGRTIMHAQST